MHRTVLSGAGAASASGWLMPRRLRRLAVLVAGALIAALPALAVPAETPHPEQRLLAALTAMQDGHISEALDDLGRLVHDEPKFRVAQLFYSQLLSARAGTRGSVLSDTDNARIADLVEEARLRLEGAQPPAGAVPDAVLQLSPKHRNAILVDLPKARLYLLENDGSGLRVTRDFYAAMGKMGYGKLRAGDNRTPVGVYRVTSWLAGDGLPDMYGAGAFPVNYPNLWDRSHGKTGSGIWLHGVPSDTYSRAPRSSEGCVTMANADLLSLREYVAPGQTPVILSDGIDWQTPEQVQAERARFLAMIEDWRAQWSAKNTNGYLAYYAPQFSTDGMDLARFVAYKRRVNASKRYIDVQLSDIDLYRYPGQPDLVLAEFTQNYRSDSFKSVSRKQQYWQLQPGGRWLIVKEEND